VYRDDLANRKYAKRQKEKPKHTRFTSDMQQHVEALLVLDYSPEQITGLSKKQDIPCVCHERIYQHVWEDKRTKGELFRPLEKEGQ